MGATAFHSKADINLGTHPSTHCPHPVSPHTNLLHAQVSDCFHKPKYDESPSMLINFPWIFTVPGKVPKSKKESSRMSVLDTVSETSYGVPSIFPLTNFAGS